MRHICWIAAAVLLAPLGSAQEETEKEPTWIALRGADIHTVTAGEYRGGTVLIKDDKIHEVGHDLELPDGTTVYDVSGLHVYPGMVALSATGLLGTRSKYEDTADPFDFNTILALSAGITSAKQGSTVVKLVRGDIEGAILREGVGVTMVGASSYNPSFQGREKLRSALRKARKYIDDFDAWAAKQAKKIDPKAKAPSRAGVNADLVKLLRREERGWVSTGGRRLIGDYADLAREFDFDLVVDGGTEAWAVADRLGRAGATVIVMPRIRMDSDERTQQPNGSRIESAAILHRHGVQIGIKTLSGGISSLGGIVGRDLLALPMDAAFAVRGGLPQDVALGALTIGAARILGVEDRVGSIEAGKDADLIVTDGDLLDYRSFTQYTFVNGKLRYDKSEEALFAHIRPRKLPAPTVVGEEREAAKKGEEAKAEAGEKKGDK